MGKHLLAASTKAKSATKQAVEVMDLLDHQPPASHHGAE
jgi:hypothetical protein